MTLKVETNCGTLKIGFCRILFPLLFCCFLSLFFLKDAAALENSGRQNIGMSNLNFKKYVYVSLVSYLFFVARGKSRTPRVLIIQTIQISIFPSKNLHKNKTEIIFHYLTSQTTKACIRDQRQYKAIFSTLKVTTLRTCYATRKLSRSSLIVQPS